MDFSNFQAMGTYKEAFFVFKIFLNFQFSGLHAVSDKLYNLLTSCGIVLFEVVDAVLSSRMFSAPRLFSSEFVSYCAPSRGATELMFCLLFLFTTSKPNGRCVVNPSFTSAYLETSFSFPRNLFNSIY